ncbi:P2X purinoceptor 7-like [Acanthaster planci]|uniref:P2X purinoceptor 7-like n=1 Tax=Acanthaster planci TaxID=133434 RepID=A0A8B7Z6U5_ACAPL|nr:P2X purinoceptor 7-like [Acanthaster planci]
MANFSSSYSTAGDGELSATDSSDESGEISGESDYERQELGVRPYMYEPERGDDGGGSVSDSDTDDEEHVARLGNNNWCECEQCTPMPSVRESKCCKEIDAVLRMTESFVLDLDCITEHPGFRTVCLDRWVLDTAYYQYRQQYGGQAHQGSENQKYRHTAYRQLARWCWGYLGREVRVVLPACAVNKIRSMFPTNDEEYTGFVDA